MEKRAERERQPGRKGWDMGDSESELKKWCFSVGIKGEETQLQNREREGEWGRGREGGSGSDREERAERGR